MKTIEIVNSILENVNTNMKESDIYEIELNNTGLTLYQFENVLQQLKAKITYYGYSYNNKYLKNGNILFWKNKAETYVQNNFEFDTLIA